MQLFCYLLAYLNVYNFIRIYKYKKQIENLESEINHDLEDIG